MSNPLQDLLNTVTGGRVGIQIMDADDLPKDLRTSIEAFFNGPRRYDLTLPSGLKAAISDQLDRIGKQVNRLATLSKIYRDEKSAEMFEDAATRDTQIQEWYHSWITNWLTPVKQTALEALDKLDPADPMYLAALTAAYQALDKYERVLTEVTNAIRDRQLLAMLQCPVDDILGSSEYHPPQDPFTFDFSSAATPPGEEAAAPSTEEQTATATS